MHLEGAEFRKLSENKAGKNGEEPQFLCIHPFLPSHCPFPAGCIPKIPFWPSFPDICAGSALSWSIPHPACDSLQFLCLKGMMAWEKTSWGRLFKPSSCSSYWMLLKGKIPRICFYKIPISFDLLMESAVPHPFVSIPLFQFFHNIGNLFRVILV